MASIHVSVSPCPAISIASLTQHIAIFSYLLCSLRRSSLSVRYTNRKKGSEEAETEASTESDSVEEALSEAVAQPTEPACEDMAEAQEQEEHTELSGRDA